MEICYSRSGTGFNAPNPPNLPQSRWRRGPETRTAGFRANLPQRRDCPTLCEMMNAVLKLLRRIVCLGALAAACMLWRLVRRRQASQRRKYRFHCAVWSATYGNRGEPFRVVVRLESSGEGTGRVELAPSTGTWVDAITVELLALGSNTSVARANPIGVPDSTRTTLDRDHVAGGLWLFAAGSTQGFSRRETTLCGPVSRSPAVPAGRARFPPTRYL